MAGRSKVSAYPLDEILGSEQPVGVATSAPTSRQPIMLWAYVVAAHEDTYHRDSHRQADGYRAGYLRHLLDLGYTLAETDRLVMGEQTLPNTTDNTDEDSAGDQANPAAQ